MRLTSNVPPPPVKKHSGKSGADATTLGIRSRQNVARFDKGQKYKEVHIPLILRNGAPFVKVNVDGRSILGMIDTGTAGIVWPRKLGLKGLHRNVIFSGHPKMHPRVGLTGPSGEWIRGEVWNIPKMRIGNYILKDQNTLRLDAYEPFIDGDVLILGNAAFDGFVVTLDCRKKELVVRTKGYNIAENNAAHLPDLIPFTWEEGGYLFAGVPIVAGHIQDKPVHLVLDTGLKDIVLRKAGTDYAGMKEQSILTSPFAKPVLRQIVTGVSLSVGRVVLENQLAMVLPKLSGKADGLVGLVLLKSHTITIDYPRKRIFLKPD